MAHLHTAYQTELAFLRPPPKFLCIYGHPTAQEAGWPHICSVLPHRLDPGSCIPNRASKLRPPGTGEEDIPGALPPPCTWRGWPLIHQ